MIKILSGEKSVTLNMLFHVKFVKLLSQMRKILNYLSKHLLFLSTCRFGLQIIWYDWENTWAAVVAWDSLDDLLDPWANWERASFIGASRVKCPNALSYVGRLDVTVNSITCRLDTSEVDSFSLYFCQCKRYQHRSIKD